MYGRKQHVSGPGNKSMCILNLFSLRIQYAFSCKILYFNTGVVEILNLLKKTRNSAYLIEINSIFK